MTTRQKLNRSFCGCYGWRQTRECNQRSENILTEKPPVKAERKSVNVALQTFRGDAMMHPVIAAVELRPKSFDGVRVGAANKVFFRAVIHAQMFESTFSDGVIDGELVGNNLNFGRNILADMLL